MIKYCQECGKKVIYKTPQNDNRIRAICTNCNFIHYENPKMIVGVLPIYKDKILLCKRAIEPKKNYWTLPSGFMENNETLEEGALREAYEEAGIQPKIIRLQCIYNIPRINQVYFLFLGQLDSEKYKCGEETTEIKFVKENEILWSEIAFSAINFSLKSFFKNKNSNQPVFGALDFY